MSRLKIQDGITASTVQTLDGARGSTTGANLDPEADIHIIGEVKVANDTIVLPLENPKLTGKVKRIRNQTNRNLRLHPPSVTGILYVTAGAGDGGSLGAGAYHTLNAKTAITLVCLNGRDWSQLD